MLNGLDLFSGIGGISEALSPWCRTIAYCERERFAQAVLLSRMARGEIDSAPIWDDVTTLEASQLPPIDIISGGFPCQDISVAGKGEGLGGKRSGLFYEICRLAGELRPSFIFLENVSAITIRGGGAVIGALTALGYDTRWITLSAAEVGATHKRERWWCLAYRNEQRRDEAGRQSPESRRRYPLRGGEGRSLAHGEEQRIGSRGIERDLCEAERRPERGMLQRSDEPSEGILEDARHGSRRPIGQAGERGNASVQWSRDHDEAGRSSADASMGNPEEGRSGRNSGTWGFRGASAGNLGHAPASGLPEPRYAGKREPGAQDQSGLHNRFELPSRPPKPGDPSWAGIIERFPEVKPALCGMASRLPNRNDRIRALGNSVDVVCAREAFKILTGLT